ncbi:MAG: hypothetical protein KA063_04925 [Firmicutes bacterium]|nr:hypothetical protein [Bacillota bacterium]
MGMMRSMTDFVKQRLIAVAEPVRGPFRRRGKRRCGYVNNPRGGVKASV